VTPLYPQKLALTWPTGGGRSVGIVRSRTKATEFFLCGNWSFFTAFTRDRHLFLFWTRSIHSAPLFYLL